MPLEKESVNDCFEEMLHVCVGRVLARVLRHTVMDQTGLPCSVLCAVCCVPI